MKTDITSYGHSERTVRGVCSTVEDMRDVELCLHDVLRVLERERQDIADVELVFTARAQTTDVGKGKVEWELTIRRTGDGK